MLENIPEILAITMLLCAVMITTARTVHTMIHNYQYQAYALMGVILFKAVNSEQTGLFIAFMLIPLFLALFIEPLLALATVPENIPAWQRLQRLFIPSQHRPARQQAASAWLRSDRSRDKRLLSLIIDLALVSLAFIFAFTLVGDPFLGMRSPGSGTNSSTWIVVLAVSFSLLLLGLSTMIARRDIISQVLGLLVMEQGMFLAAVWMMPNTSVTIVFVVGLFIYTIITLTILVFLLPELHHISGSVEIDQQVQLKG